MLDAERYNIMKNQWFCVYLLTLIRRINVIEMILVIEFMRIQNHAVMQTLVSFAKNIFSVYRQTEQLRRLDLSGTLIICHV